MCCFAHMNDTILKKYSSVGNNALCVLSVCSAMGVTCSPLSTVTWFISTPPRPSTTSWIWKVTAARSVQLEFPPSACKVCFICIWKWEGVVLKGIDGEVGVASCLYTEVERKLEEGCHIAHVQQGCCFFFFFKPVSLHELTWQNIWVNLNYIYKSS